MRIVIVDDSDARSELILRKLSTLSFAGAIDVTRCASADEARRAFLSPCDLAVLDLLLPKKRLGTPAAAIGVALLNDVCNPESRYIRPRMIVGLTADGAGLTSYRKQYATQASIVLDGALNDLDWLEALIAQVESLAAAQKKIQQTKVDRVLITIHGIRTYGKWQQRLSESITGYSRNFESVELKYEFVDFVSFFFPLTRAASLERNVNRLLLELEKHSKRDVYIVAHSFGTLIVSEALRRWQPGGGKKLSCVILAGSPIDREVDIEHIVSKSVRTVNECGTLDCTLLFARVFLIGLGDAGRSGFLRSNSDNFINRYYCGGHSLYFKRSNGGVYFFEKHWFRLLTLNHAPKRADSRIGFPFQDAAHLLLAFLTKIKLGWYVAAVTGVVWWGAHLVL